MDGYGRIEWLLAELHRQIAWQGGQIAEMRRLLAGLQQAAGALGERLSRLEERAPVHVERIDYQFEQLKVERLDGTLVIGMAPGGTGTIEDLAVAGKPAGDVAWGEARKPAEEEAFVRVREKVRRFLSGEFPALLAEQARALGVALPPDCVTAIVEDIGKQVDDRIRLYMARMRETAGEPGPGTGNGNVDGNAHGNTAGNASGSAAGDAGGDGDRRSGGAGGPDANPAGNTPAPWREEDIVRRVLRDIRNAIPSYLQMFENGGANEHDG